MRLLPRRRTYVDDLPKTHDARFLAVFLTILLVLLGAVYVVGYAVAGDKVPSGTTVAGAHIGGLTRNAAARVIERTLSAKLARPLSAEAGGHRVRFVPSRAGVGVDLDATLDAAMSGTDWDPRHMLAVVEGGGRVDPVLTVDPQRLARALAPLTAAVRTEPTSTTVSVLAGKPVIRAGQAGHRLDLAAAAALVSRAVVAGRHVVSLRLDAVEAPVGYREARRFVASTLRPALGGPVVVTVGQVRLHVTPAQFAPALRIGTSGGRLRLTVSDDVLLAHTSGVLASLPGRPVNARIDFGSGRPVVVPGRPGRTVDESAWATAVLTAATSPSRHAGAPSRRAAPRFTTADARALHLSSLLASGSASTAERFEAGLRTAAAALDGSVVLPGAELSYRRAAGAASPLSPLGAAAERAASRAGMRITQRPSGRLSGRDLTFTNTTNYPVYVRAWTARAPRGGVSATVQLWGT